MAKDSFEKELQKLEKIAEDLEKGDLGLEQALQKYEAGIAAYKKCQQILSALEKKVEILTKTAPGEVKAKPFAPGEEEEEKTGETEESEGGSDLF
jgi:exodeoxyribonuclease VII small subunit